MEFLEDIIGIEWKNNITIEQIMYVKNKISPFIFCEVVLLWLLNLKPCSAVISLLIDEMFSFRLSHSFYMDIAAELFRMGYLRQRHILNKLGSGQNFKYHRQTWLICKEKIQSFSDMKIIKLSERCELGGCDLPIHSVTVLLEPLYDTKIRMIRDKFLNVNGEHSHSQYCHWYLTLSKNNECEETLFLTTENVENIVERLKNSDAAKLYCFLPLLGF
jgi:hypothetical protein